jgi:hypothetical protein
VARLRGSEIFELAPGERADAEIPLSNADVHEGEPIDILGLVEKDVKAQGEFALWAFSVKGKVFEDLSSAPCQSAGGPHAMHLSQLE